MSVICELVADEKACYHHEFEAGLGYIVRSRSYVKKKKEATLNLGWFWLHLIGDGNLCICLVWGPLSLYEQRSECPLGCSAGHEVKVWQYLDKYRKCHQVWTWGDPWFPSMELIGQQSDGCLGGVSCEGGSSERLHCRRFLLDEEVREKLSQGGFLNTWKVRRAQKPRLYNGATSVSSTKRCWNNRASLCRKLNLDQTKHPSQTGMQNGLDLGVKCKSISWETAGHAGAPELGCDFSDNSKSMMCERQTGQAKITPFKNFSGGKDNAKRWAPDGVGIFAKVLSANCYPKHSRNSWSSTINKHATQWK